MTACSLRDELHSHLSDRDYSQTSFHEVRPVSLLLRCISSLRVHRIFCAAAPLLFAASAARLDAQFDTAIVPHHYIVVYRNAAVPGDAESRIHSAGARLLRRNDRFGMAVVDTGSVSSTSEDDATVMRRLAAQPNVDFVLHDRTVTATRMILAPAIHPSFSVVIGPLPVTLHPIGPATGHDPEPPPVPPARYAF